MKKFALASSLAILVAGYYVWGSKPESYATKNHHQYVSALYKQSTLARTDTVPKKDTSRRKDSLQ